MEPLSKLKQFIKGNAGKLARSHIVHDSNRITVEWTFRDGTKKQVQADWGDIQGVTAFKRDCLLVDLICLAIKTQDFAFEINEEMEGYRSLVESLPQYLPGAPKQEQWFQRVAIPAFETNATEIFRRQ